MVILQVWKEVGLHASLPEAAERIGGILRDEMPLRGLVVRRLETERQRLDTLVAQRVGGTGSPDVVARSEMTAGQMEALVEWARMEGSARSPLPEPASLVVSGGRRADTLVGSLLDGERVIGFAIAYGAVGGFTETHQRLWDRLREPLSVALRTELERHELVRYREALEADKQALLNRLGRQEITEAIVGSDAGLRSVMERVEQVARTDVPVLLLGETGTGKEVIAREIHQLSGRGERPVVRVNCGAIPAGLIDSELFGHERGSFTGAVADRAGWFERADGGTLFLDEIGELSAEAQVRLLRVLQDGTFERVGGRRTQTVDVRIVAATHRDLQSMVPAGRFREDLWYRISIFPIRLPPLRERPSDIPALAQHFAWRAGKRIGGAPLAPSAHDLELLLGYAWPGNVRELASVIERAVLLGGGHRLEIGGALGGGGAAEGNRLSSPPHGAGEADYGGQGMGEIVPLDDAVRAHIESALIHCHGRVEGPSGAAALLRVNPHTLRARMRKLGIEWGRYRAPGNP